MNEPRSRLLSDDAILLSECSVRAQRRSGPGGQHRNKVETGIFLTHLPSGLSAGATERRSQAENRQVAVARLRLRMAIAVRETPAEASSLWQSRCHSRRVTVSHRHPDYAQLLAEAFDHLSAAQWQPTVAARALHCSVSSLVRLVRRDAQAWQYLNQKRLERGLAPLR
jgi:hypothetical protein